MITLESDRRLHARHDLARPCRVEDCRTGKFLHGTTCNYSQGGVLLRIHRSCRLQPGDSIRIGIALTEGQQGFMQARDMFEATVVRALGTPAGETIIAARNSQAQAPLHGSLRQAA